MATDWPGKMDPGEQIEFIAMFGGAENPVLDVDNAETIASFTVSPTAEAAALGVEVMAANGRDPVLVQGDTAVQLWLSVNPANQADPEFSNGVKVGIEVTIVTDSVPARTRQRTWNVEIAQL